MCNYRSISSIMPHGLLGYPCSNKLFGWLWCMLKCQMLFSTLHPHNFSDINFTRSLLQLIFLATLLLYFFSVNILAFYFTEKIELERTSLSSLFPTLLTCVHVLSAFAPFGYDSFVPWILSSFPKFIIASLSLHQHLLYFQWIISISIQLCCTNNK